MRKFTSFIKNHAQLMKLLVFYLLVSSGFYQSLWKEIFIHLVLFDELFSSDNRKIGGKLVLQVWSLELEDKLEKKLDKQKKTLNDDNINVKFIC